MKKKDTFVSRLQVLKFIVVIVSAIAVFTMIVKSGSIQGLNPSIDLQKKELLESLAKRELKEGVFVDANDEYITLSDHEGKDGTCLYPKAYGWIIGFNDPSWGKQGLRKVLEKTLWTDQAQNTVKLTTDNDLQSSAYRILEQLKTNDGSVIVLENSTGKIKALASKGPAELNNNDPQAFISEANKTADGFLWRGVQDLYPPGSTFKLVTGVAALEKGYTGKELIYTDTGVFQCADGSDPVQNYGGYAYGQMDLSYAYEVSANTYFANLALKVGNAQMTETAKKLRFNESIQLDFCTLTSNFSLDGSDFSLSQTGFGQGETLLSPLHLAMIFQTIENDGTMIKPYMIDSIKSKDESIYEGQVEKLSEVFSKASCQKIRKAAKYAANAYGLPTYTTFAKSGTAEIPENKTMSYLGACDDQYTYLIACKDVTSSLDLYDSMNTLMSLTK